MRSLRAEVDAARLVVIYRRVDGTEVFRDSAPRIVMKDKGNESLEAALRVAAQKYGGRVQMTGSDMFQERAARMATRLGIAVHNADLRGIVIDERRRLDERWVEPQAPQPWMNTGNRSAAHIRSRGLERRLWVPDWLLLRLCRFRRGRLLSGRACATQL